MCIGGWGGWGAGELNGEAKLGQFGSSAVIQPGLATRVVALIRDSAINTPYGSSGVSHPRTSTRKSAVSFRSGHSKPMEAKKGFTSPILDDWPWPMCTPYSRQKYAIWQWRRVAPTHLDEEVGGVLLVGAGEADGGEEGLHLAHRAHTR
jgi:hypothetical protein